MKVIISGLVWLPRSSLNRHHIGNIKRELTIQPRKTTDIQTKEEPAPIFLFEEDEKRDLIGVPRGYYIERNSVENEEVLDVSYGRPLSDFKTNFKAEGPFAEQNRALEELGVALEGREWGGVLLRGAPGFGKTIASLEFARRIGRKTLILVHKDFLVRQWRKSIRKLMPDARIGMIKQKLCEFDEIGSNGEEPDFVIGLLQSLSRDDGFKYPDKLYSAFGTIISDESLPYEARVLTEDGYAEIGKLVKSDKAVKVAAYDQFNDSFHWREVTKRWAHPPKCEMLEVVHERGTFRCTSNHVVVTPKGDVKAKDLVSDRDSVVFMGHDKAKQFVQDCEGAGSLLWQSERDGGASSVASKILAVRPVHTPNEVYDLTVDEFHNFVVEGAVVHNCHRVGAGSWAGIMPRFRAAWRVGLSATPRRKDGAQDVFFKHISPITYAATTKMMRPKLRRVYTSSVLKPISRGHYRVSVSNLNSAQVINQLAADRFRTRDIVDDLAKGVAAGRKILVVSERLGHLRDMSEQLGKILFDMDLPFAPRVDFYTGQWFSGEVWEATKRGKKGNILHRKGESKLKTRTEEELEKAESANVLFATKQMIEEGFNVPPLDVLVLTMPMGDVEQAVGRVQRWCLPEEGKCNTLCPWRAGKCKGKPHPIMVDVVDESIDQLNSKYCRRLKFYKKLGML